MRHTRWMLGLGLVAVLAGGGYALRARGGDAPATGVASQEPTPLRAEGRVVALPGADVVVGTEVGGTVVRLQVSEGDRVRQGQVLAELDTRQEAANLAEAQAAHAERDADVAFLNREVLRQEALQAAGIVSRQSLDQIQTQRVLAQARREAALATSHRLAVAVAKRRILAPRDGVVVSRWVHAGETLAPGSRMFQLANPDLVRVEAEIDEFDVARLRTGMPVRLRAEGQDVTWSGRVDELPAQVVTRRLKPQDPARPADTRVLLAKIILLEKTPLKLGQRVELELK